MISILHFLPKKEQEVLDAVEVKKVEVSTKESKEVIEVTLSKKVDNAKFYVNGTIVNSTKVTSKEENGVCVYTLTLDEDTLNKNEENTLRVIDEEGTFDKTETFTYRVMIAPSSVSVAPGAGNSINMVNASNVNSATIQVLFEDGNRNTLPVTIEVTIEDTADEEKGEVKHTVTKTIEATTMETVEKITGVDLSSFNEGKLTLTAVVKDSEGNVSAPTENKTVTKIADAPIVKYASASRKDTTHATITDLTSTNQAGSNNDTIYYLVKEQGETAPTVDEVIEGNKTLSAGPSVDADITDGVNGKVYVVYLVAKTTTGTKSTEVVAIQVAKQGATQIAPVEKENIVKVDGTEATYEWNYNEETEGFVGYRVVLKDNNQKVLVDKTINKGEETRVDFLETLKQQKDIESYTIEVIALADNVDYQNATAIATEAQKINPVISQHITLAIENDENDEKKILLTWSTTDTNTTAVDHYLVEVAKYDKSAKDKEYTTNVKSFTTTELKYDIAPVVEEMGAGTYRFNVTAVAREELLRSNVSAEDSIAESKTVYHQGRKISGLTATVSGQKVTLKGTLLSKEDLFDDGATPKAEIKYNLHYRKSETETNYSSAASDTNISELPHDVVSSLDSGTKYDFIIETEVTNGTVKKSFYSDPVSATTELGAILATNAKYVQYKETSAIDSTPALENNRLTYKDGVLYIKSGDTVKSYTSEKYPEVTKIIAVLNQMGENDTVSINEKITELALYAEDATVEKTYDLTNVPANAKVTVTGNASRVTGVKGNLTEITLASSNEFNLSELTANVVNVSKANATLTANAGTTLKFGSSAATVTVNDVALGGVASGNATVTSDGFEFAGNALTALTVDSSESTKVVNLKFSGATPKTLNITADEANGVKLATNTIAIEELNVLNGKVDISNSPFKELTVGDSEATDKTKKVILVSSNTSSDVLNGKEITKDPTLIDWFGYYLTLKDSTSDKKATVDYASNSSELKITLEKGAQVTFGKKTETLEGKKNDMADVDTVMEGDPQLEKYKANMEAIGDVTVDKKTNTITVNIKDKMETYTSSKDTGAKGTEHAYYSLLIDVGVSRNSLKVGAKDGQKYYALEDDDIKASEALGASETEVLVWLYADKEESIIDFVTEDGQHLYFTVKVVGYEE